MTWYIRRRIMDGAGVGQARVPALGSLNHGNEFLVITSVVEVCVGSAKSMYFPSVKYFLVER